jgi:hypothetical protein
MAAIFAIPDNPHDYHELRERMLARRQAVGQEWQEFDAALADLVEDFDKMKKDTSVHPFDALGVIAIHTSYLEHALEVLMRHISDDDPEDADASLEVRPHRGPEPDRDELGNYLDA